MTTRLKPMTTSPVTAIAEADWARAVKTIDSASQVWLACHIRPDADALGSMLAFAAALVSGRPGLPVAASFGEDPFAVPGNPAVPARSAAAAAAGEYPARPEVVVCFDAASIDRLGLLAGRRPPRAT